MTKFEEILTNEYVNEHISMAKKQYSEPKIYDAKGYISERWYAYTAIGILDWHLFGIRVFSQGKEFTGTFKLKKS